MAFVVEDGSEVAGANAYADVAFVDAYFNDRMITGWSMITDPAKKQANIIAATDYIDTRWGASGFKSRAYSLGGSRGRLAAGE